MKQNTIDNIENTKHSTRQKERDNQSTDLIHGDIEHFYEVDIEGFKSDFCSSEELEETLGEIISDSDESDSEEKIRLDVEHGYVQYLQVYDHDKVPFEAVVDELRGSMTVERNRTNYNLGDL
jgi:hypothetical protein